MIQPSIDVFSPKNSEQTREQSLSICRAPGSSRIVQWPTRRSLAPTARPAAVDRQAEMRELAPLSADDGLVAQVSRWDRLKDPVGVLRGFAEHVAGAVHAHLLLAGPATESVADDPEGIGVYRAVVHEWGQLPDRLRRRVHLASLPMDDIEENAAIVNAIQRHCDVVVQKSLAEGFGLTVAEAMWKERPVVASRVGGIQDQIVDRVSGVLVSDPRDLREFGSAVAGLLTDPSGRGDRLRRPASGCARTSSDRTTCPATSN